MAPSSGLPAVAEPGIAFTLATVLTITTGTIFIMWLGEQITEYGIGNGISLIIFIGIIAELPFALKSEWSHYMINRGAGKNIIEELFLIALMFAVVAFVILLTQGQRRIPVQYAKRVVGRRVYGGQTTHIPLRINTAGVIPIIFAQSIMFLPGTVTQMFSRQPGHGGDRDLLFNRVFVLLVRVRDDDRLLLLLLHCHRYGFRISFRTT